MRIATILAKKVINLVITLFAVWTLNFFLFHMLPGNPTFALLPARVPPQIRENMMVAFGLNKPLLEQYFVSLHSAITGNFGYSWYFRGQLVWNVVLERLKYTLLLVGTGTIIAVLLGVKLGVIAGSQRGEASDVAIMGISLSFYSMPAFWLGMILLMILAGQYRLFPLFGFETVGSSNQSLLATILDRLWHMFLPVLTFVLITISEFILMMRSALVDVLTEDYVTTARAKGLTPRDVVNRHAVPNALIPTIALTAMYIGWVVTGAIMIEVVFSWPGIGMLTWQALVVRDFPVLQCVFIVVAVTMLIANFVADLVYLHVDPRVKL